MHKKFFSAFILGISTLNYVYAQRQTAPSGAAPGLSNYLPKSLTVYYDGNDGYSAPGSFIFWVTTNNNVDTLKYEFTTPGSHVFAVPSNQLLGVIGFKFTSTNYTNAYQSTLFSTYYGNSLQIGIPYVNYCGYAAYDFNINDLVFYDCVDTKTSLTDWHFRLKKRQ